MIRLLLGGLKMYRKTAVLVDCDILTDNIKCIRKRYNYDYYIGVVKANAYGHGDYIVNSLIRGGVNYLAASSLEECLSIRKRNESIPILCLEPINVSYLNICSQNNITITVPDLDYYNEMKSDVNLKIHLKIDCGMNRLGFKDKTEVKTVVDDIKNKDNLYLEGIYTHFATSGIWDKNWDNNLQQFCDITSLIDLESIPIVHLGRSLTMVNHDKIPFANGIRMGIVMYGFAQNMPVPTGLRAIKRNYVLKRNNISPTHLTNNLKLKTAFILRSEIMSIKSVKKGECVGYGAEYHAADDILIGIIPIGFADGFLSGNNGRKVKINGIGYEVIGGIGMDMTIVKIDENVHLHDEVILYDDIKAASIYNGINGYKLLTSVTNRVPRIYKEKDKYTEIKY